VTASRVTPESSITSGTPRDPATRRPTAHDGYTNVPGEADDGARCPVGQPDGDDGLHLGDVCTTRVRGNERWFASS
jgi:hypothetical protein